MLVLDMSDPKPVKPMTEAEASLLERVLDGSEPRELGGLIAQVQAERHADKFSEYQALWNAERDARAACYAFSASLPYALTCAWYNQCDKEWGAAHPEAKE